MATNYPGGQDTFDTIPPTTKMSEAVGGRTHRAILNDVSDAVEAIELELGTDPSGSETNVVTRLAKIEDGTRLANNSITAAQIAANAVGASELADNAVDTNAIADSAVTSAKIADSAVTSAKIADGTITSTDVAADTFAAFGTVGNLLTAAQATPTTGAYNMVSGTEVNGVFTATGTSAMSARVDDIPVTAGQTYTFESTLAPVGRTAYTYMKFLDSGGGTVSLLAGRTITAGATGISRIVTVAPAGAVAVVIYPAYTGTGSGGDTVTVTNVGFWKGASGQWAMPGTPIFGQSHIAVNGAVHLSGTGTPEGKTTAAPGSTWLQTDSTTDVKGWIRWQKATGTGSTGWVAGAEADTGWRDVSSLLVNGWAYSGYPPTMRRIGSRVVLEFGYRLNGTSATSTTVLDVPAGFQRTTARQGGFFTAGVVMANSNSGIHASTGNTDLLPAGFDTNTGGANGVTVNSTNLAITGRLEWETANAWPSSLPGSAV